MDDALGHFDDADCPEAKNESLDRNRFDRFVADRTCSGGEPNEWIPDTD